MTSYGEQNDRREFLKQSAKLGAVGAAFGARPGNASEPISMCKTITADEATILPPARTFLGAPPCHDLNTLDATIAFLGIPNDQGTNTPTKKRNP
jgi:hypothetical protein